MIIIGCGFMRDMTGNFDRFQDWVPVRVDTRDFEPMVDWCYAGDVRFTDPFFRDTVRRIVRSPFSLLFGRQTSLDFLRDLSEAGPGLRPTGFIFHMSRCGSTLVAQMLAAVSKNIVISEAPPIDSMLSLAADGNGAEALRWMISAFGRPRTESEHRYFIKFDSWNTLDIDFIRKAFPDVPWIFLYRNPIEVIVSQMRQRGSHMIPGAIEGLLAGLELDDALQMAPEEFCARVLARICSAALDHQEDANGRFVNYDELPCAVEAILREHFGVSCDPDELVQMRDAARFNAKTPQLNFEPDTEKKRAEASQAAFDAAKKWVDPIYRRLEEARLDRTR